VIAILDYGAGNLRSVTNALRALDVPLKVINAAPDLLRAGKIILPGVGHFGQMMRSLEALQVRNALRERIQAGVPFLGICLGLQALFESSDEAPDAPGLGWFRGHIKKFVGDMRVPHMGWSDIELGNTLHGEDPPPRPASKLLNGLPARPFVYFAHSYYAPVAPSTAATCAYGGLPFTAAIECGNVFGVQFHPEKSGAIGRRVLQNFAEI
jgi:imidazole glycerol phosphate synthase glutamine amidotransferase subunit